MMGIVYNKYLVPSIFIGLCMQLCRLKGNVEVQQIKLHNDNYQLTCSKSSNSKIKILNGTVLGTNFNCKNINTSPVCVLHSNTVQTIALMCDNKTSCSLNTSTVGSDNCLTDPDKQFYVRVRVVFHCMNNAGIVASKRNIRRANKIFNYRCNETTGEKLSIENVAVKQESACYNDEDQSYCYSNNIKQKFQEICTKKSVCDVNGSEVMDLSEACLKTNQFLYLEYNCTEDFDQVFVSNKRSQNEENFPVSVIIGGIIGGIIFIIVIILIVCLIKSKMKQHENVNQQDEVAIQNNKTLPVSNPAYFSTLVSDATDSIEISRKRYNKNSYVNSEEKDLLAHSKADMEMLNAKLRNDKISVHFDTNEYAYSNLEDVGYEFPTSHKIENTGSVDGVGLYSYTSVDISSNKNNVKLDKDVGVVIPEPSDSTGYTDFTADLTQKESTGGHVMEKNEESLTETNEGVYDKSGETRQINVNTNMYGHTTDGVYDSASQSKPHDNENLAWYDHFPVKNNQ